MKSLTVQNRQRVFKISSKKIQEAVRCIMDVLFRYKAYHLSIILINEKRMAEINQEHLNHKGATDVITFDYSEGNLPNSEIIICPAIANGYAKRHNVSLGRELARYIIHGVLHIQGYNDLTQKDRSIMKRKENRTLNKLSRLIPVDDISYG